ncbi:Inosine/uridine-preferring nucleoside hydrolase domain-containing protein [Boeremia exigua]|uniref:Inosine/uridine-preferring nucleoside hydrolase domain-containing protein n=1 Tax=Boeremia exigua TaxID=749465 RepID=UPI001E8CB5B2|nr:Inosine/uridine-preferring nucleoside hydrolase domain-containing protein [Boeremia exigua]KAH6633158.1 Inosine/uridine-preferring nucleoside hydrolase domain-containing protein [Boeremia exigua]
MASRIPLWLDCDTGHDDAYALLLCAHDPRVELLGTSTVHGNAALDQTTFNTRAILEALGRRDVKVYTGAAKPIVRDAVHAADIHGESGLDGVTLLPQPVEPAATDVPYLEAMYRALIATPPNTAWLVSTGTLTNIGLLFQQYPDLAGHLKGLSIMGGAVGHQFTDAPMGKVQGEGERFGNWTAYAEFNIYCDPEASAFIFAHPVLRPKTTLVPLDLSHLVLGTQSVRRSLLYGRAAATHTDTPTDTPRTPSTLRALFAQIMSFFAGTYATVFSLTAGPPLHDPLAVAAAIYPELFDDRGGERFRVDVVTAGVHSLVQSEVGELGRTKVTPLPPGEGGCRIPRAVDLERFWGLVEDGLARADAVSPLPVVDRGVLERDGVFVGID